MSICKPCAEAADLNRWAYNHGNDHQVVHPEDCGCPCMHKPTKDWADYFASPEPERE